MMKTKQQVIQAEEHGQALWMQEESNFTSKEEDVLACLLVGKSSKKIAGILEIKARSVDTHIYNMMHKLGVHSRASLINMAEKYGNRDQLGARYARLLRAHNFKETVQKTAAYTRAQHISCHIICTDKPLLEKMVFYLKKVGISVLQDGDGINTIEIKTIDSASSSAKSIGTEGIADVDSVMRPSFFSIVHTGNDEGLFFEIVYYLCPSPWINEACDYFSKLPPIDYQYGQGDYGDHDIFKISSRHSERAYARTYAWWQSRKSMLYGLVLFFLICLCAVLFLKTIYDPKNNADIVVAHSVLTIPEDTRRLDRKQIMSKIDQIFGGFNNTYGRYGVHDIQRIQTVVLVGIGGSGKTTLARQYAHRQNCPIVWEINAENYKTILASFELLAYALAKTSEEKTELDRIKQLENMKEYAQRLLVFVKQKMLLHKKWLLIFDNVDNFSDIEPFYPNDAKAWGGGRILITTRNDHIKDNHHIQKQAVVPVTALDAQEQMTLFRKILHSIHDMETKKIESFLTHVPPFPLDIAIAAQYIKTTGISYDDYLKNLSRISDAFEKTQHVLVKKMTSYDKTRYGIIGCMMKDLLTAHPEFTGLLLFTSVIGSQNIPKSLLALYADQAQVSQFIAEMCTYSMFSYHAKNQHHVGDLSIHRSMQHNILIYLRQVLNLKEQQEIFDQIVQTLERYCEPMIERADVAAMRHITYHLQSLLEKSEILDNPHHQGRIELILGDIYGGLGDPVPAKTLLYTSVNHLSDHLTLCDKKDKKHASSQRALVRALTRTGSAEKDCANYEQAKTLLEQSLRLQDHPGIGDAEALELALTLCNLSYVYRFTTEYDKAKVAIDRCIALYKKYDPHGLNYALALSELALFYNYSNGDYKQAIAYRLESLAMVEKLCGPTHLKTIWVRGLLGMDLRGAGRYQEALTVFKASYDIYKERYAASFYHIFWITSNVGSTYRLLGCFAQAKPFLMNACCIAKKYFGEEHIHTHWIHIALSQLYLETGHAKEAQCLLEASLKAHSEQFGPAHYKVGSILHVLGLVYTELGLYEQAKDCFERSLIIYEKKYGRHHSDYAIILKDYGRFYGIHGDFDTAHKLINEALVVFQKENHPEAYRCFEYLGDLYAKQGKKADAQVAYQSALLILQAQFPKESMHSVRIMKMLQAIPLR